MFFNITLLHPQHKLRLSLPWKAATIGISSVSNQNIKTCDVITLCNYITEFITNNSLNPSKRFSLRLSSILIHGVCLIYRKQVIFLQADIDHFITRRERATLQYIMPDEESPLPQPKVKKPKKKENLSATPESLQMISRSIPRIEKVPEFALEPLGLIEMPEVDVIQPARIDEITLREEMPRGQELLRLDDDFGELEIPLQPLPRGSSITEEPIQPVTTAMSLLALEKELDSIPEKRLEVTQEKYLDIAHEKEQEIAVPVAAPIDDAVPQMPTEVEVRKEPTTKDTVSFKIPRKPKQVIPTTSLLRKPPKKFVTINKEQKIVEEYKFVVSISKVPAFRPFEKFWSDWDTMPEMDAAREAVEVDSVRISGRSIYLESESSGTPNVVTPLVQTVDVHAEIITEPSLTPRKRPRETFTEVFPPAASEPIQVFEIPKKRQKIVTIEEVQAEDVGLQKLLEETPLVESMETIEITGRPPTPTDEFSGKWVDDVMLVVFKHERKIEIIEICNEMGKRPTKLTMARIFASLLALAKERYVLLHSKHDSCELEFIEKGPKPYPF